MSSIISRVKTRSIEILETSEYDKFDLMKENREISESHVKRQMRGLEKHGWIIDQPMQVVRSTSGKWLIVDGQHRFLAAKKLGIPVIYIVKPETDYYQAIQVQHAYNKPWTTKDYLEHWCARGREPYLYLADFINRHELPIGSAIAIITDSINQLKSGSISAKSLKSSNIRDCFKDGDLEFSEDKRQAAENRANLIAEVRFSSPYSEKIRKDGRFINALLLIMNHPDYEHARFMKQISKQSTLFVKCPTMDHYLELILGIYNRKYREERSLKSDHIKKSTRINLYKNADI